VFRQADQIAGDRQNAVVQGIAPKAPRPIWPIMLADFATVPRRKITAMIAAVSFDACEMLTATMRMLFRQLAAIVANGNPITMEPIQIPSKFDD
jgi:hypothetical protein